MVIGILIALQINNWNEEKKQKDFGKKLLGDIRVTVMNNRDALNWVIEYNQEGMASAEIILAHLSEDLPYHDSLDVHFSKAIQYGVPTIRNDDYESLKSYRLNLLQNDTLMKVMNNTYAQTYWLETLEFRQENYFQNTVFPILTGMFETVAMRSKMKPFDYDALKNSREYISILNSMNAHREDQNKWYSETIMSLEELEKMIVKSH